MALVPVSQLKPGDTINQNVMTQRSNLLLPKGLVLQERELEILRAFLIPKVHIEGKAVEQSNQEAASDNEKPVNSSQLAFYDAYDKMVVLLKQVFTLAILSDSLPVLEIRTRLEALLACISEYNIMFFKPIKYHPRDYLYHKSIKAGLTSFLLGKWCGFPQKDLIPIALGGLLHDIGNARIDPALLQKSSNLTSLEYEEIKKHTLLGYQILKNAPGTNEGSKLTALQHHERLDGSGYPLGLQGDSIHPYSRIVAIADNYHAMSSDRVYKSSISPYLVLEELSKSAFGKLDPTYVQMLIFKATQFQTGSVVKLSDNRIGEIVFSQREYPTRPWVKVNGIIVNLATERKLYIQDMIQ